jgi:hypothetical protein
MSEGLPVPKGIDQSERRPRDAERQRAREQQQQQDANQPKTFRWDGITRESLPPRYKVTFPDGDMQYVSGERLAALYEREGLPVPKGI